jgi:hypothetical protein
MGRETIMRRTILFLSWLSFVLLATGVSAAAEPGLARAPHSWASHPPAQHRTWEVLYAQEPGGLAANASTGYGSELADDIPSAEAGVEFNTVTLWVAEWLGAWTDPQGLVIRIYDQQCPPALSPELVFTFAWDDLDVVFWNEIPGLMTIYQVTAQLPEPVTASANMSIGGYVLNNWGNNPPFCGFLSAGETLPFVGCGPMYWDNSADGFPRWTLFEYGSYSPDLGYYLGWSVTSGAPDSALPTAELLPASPNPFNATTTLRFRLAQPGVARLTVHDGRGRLVQGLVLEAQNAGMQQVVWDGRDRSGRPVPSGIYLVHLRVAGRSAGSGRIALVE